MKLADSDASDRRICHPSLSWLLRYRDVSKIHGYLQPLSECHGHTPLIELYELRDTIKASKQLADLSLQAGRFVGNWHRQFA
jgi:hypothetical protein